MIENGHDPLEQLFREKSNEFEVGFHEADWNDMENRLDQMDSLLLLNKQNSLMRRRFAAVAVALIILAVGFFTYRNYNRINELEQQLSMQNENNLNDLNPDNANNALNAIADNKIDRKKASLSGEQVTADKAMQSAFQRNEMVETINGKAAKTPSDTDVTVEFKKANILIASDIQPLENLYQRIANNASLTEAKFIAGSNAETDENNNAIVAATFDDNSKATVSTSSVGPYRASSGFAVGVTVGPDFSTVGSLSNFYTPGFKIGATVEYNWSKNFGVSAGLIYSKVNYTAQGNEYKPPYGFWDYGIIPQKTFAQCAILSIPIRVKYDFAHLSNSRFYVTAGVSSYIMLNEAYQFNYAENNASDLVQSWNGRTHTKHWLSNATISIGYEFDINQTLSLRVEPYLNIPLQKVGWGNVELFSTGSFISLNYHFK